MDPRCIHFVWTKHKIDSNLTKQPRPWPWFLFGNGYSIIIDAMHISRFCLWEAATFSFRMKNLSPAPKLINFSHSLSKQSERNSHKIWLVLPIWEANQQYFSYSEFLITDLIKIKNIKNIHFKILHYKNIILESF